MRFSAKTAGLSSALAAPAVALLLNAVPVQAQTGSESPCDSETVVPAGQDALRADCEALWAFYTQLEDPGVLDDAGDSQWGPNNPLSSWRGVTISPPGRVTALSLNSSGLVGPLPPELGRLTALTRLNLNLNELSGSIPSELGQLVALQNLALGDNNLLGGLPSELGRLSNLRYLWLNGNRLSGSIPSELGQLSNLTHLLLDNNGLSGSIPSELGRLTKLKELKLWGNDLTGSIPSDLGRLTNLINLDLGVNNLSGPIPTELGQLAALKTLALGDNRLSGSIPPELGQLSELVDLYLWGNDLTGSIPADLGRLSALEELDLGENNLSGRLPSELSRFDPVSRFDQSPMDLIDSTESHSEFTVSSEVWDVWLCDTSPENFARGPDEIVTFLSREITPYYRWLSNGRYRPRFRYIDRTEGPHLSGCIKTVQAKRATVSSDNPFMVIDGDDLSGRGGWGVSGKNRRVGTIGLGVSTIIHEIGHALGFPHSYGGLIYWESDNPFGGRTTIMAGDVYEYDNPMDMMSHEVGFNTAMIAVHRYAAGWLDPANVAIHPQSKTHTYELRPPGAGGTQMLVLRDPQFGAMITLGARVAKGYDSDIPKEGVEAYKVDQFTRRIQQIPPPELIGITGENLDDETKARLTQHVYSVGDVFEVGTATVEVVERVGDRFRVRVVDMAEPGYAGRFSDEDGSAHEGNIEAIAARGVTLGCSPTYPGLFCPGRVVTRAQMMAFLARALGLEDGVETLTSRFADVSGGAWYSSYLERLADLGVVEPYEDGTFRPSEPLTRRDMAVFLTRAFAHISPVAEPAGAFEDVPADAVGAAEVEAILAAGVTRGCSAEPMRYCPEEPVTRAQMASFLTRALQE